MIFAIDPGTEQSAIVVYSPSSQRVTTNVTMPNERAIDWLRECRQSEHVLVVERIESFGMAVGRETFETVWWSGRFHEAWQPARAERVSRKDVKIHLCNSARATDSNIRHAIYDRYGGQTRARGRKKEPGPLYGLKGHEYAALAVAITFAERQA